MKEVASNSEISDRIPRERIACKIFVLMFAFAIFGVILFVSINGNRVFAEPLPKGAFERYIQSNDRFGTKFFRNLHAQELDKNTVYSPLGISSIFAILREGAEDEIRNELDKAFEWAPGQELAAPHRLLRARFIVPSPPLPEKERRREAKKNYDKLMHELPNEARPDWGFERYYQSQEAFAAEAREELYVSSTLQFHGHKVSEAFSRWFLEQANDYFGLAINEIADSHEWETVISKFPPVQPKPDSGQSERLFVLNSVVHLGTKWKDNTFVLNEPKPGTFHPNPKSSVPITMLVSEFGAYPYAKTDKYEAVILPAENADFMVIMPAEGVSLRAIDEAFADDPGSLWSQLDESYGDVELPEFSFISENDVRQHLEGLGAKQIFRNLGDLVEIPGSRLLALNQVVSFTVDQSGIQADAKTVIPGVLGGVMMGDEAFHLKVTRPFIFQVRDNLTGVLLFMGAVADPSRH